MGSTGPMQGAKRVWPDRHDERLLEKRADRMAQYLGVPYQAIEDGLCNWAKEEDDGEAAPCQLGGASRVTWEGSEDNLS